MSAATPCSARNSACSRYASRVEAPEPPIITTAGWRPPPAGASSSPLSRTPSPPVNETGSSIRTGDELPSLGFGGGGFRLGGPARPCPGGGARAPGAGTSVGGGVPGAGNPPLEGGAPPPEPPEPQPRMAAANSPAR